MMIPVTDDEIAAMEALLVQISAAPWKAWSARANVKPSIIHPPGDAELGNWMIAEKVRWEIDGDFIAACRQFVPAIIARQRADAERIARLEAQIKKLRSALEPLIRHAGTAAFHSKEMCPVMLSDVKDAAAVLEETAPASNDRGVR